MKRESIEYIYPKATTYLSAAIEVNGKFLILRNADDEIFKKLGFYFPGCKQNKDYDDAKYLIEQVHLKYGIDITINSFIGDVIVKDRRHKYSCLCLYKCSLVSKEQIKNKDIKSLFVPISKFKFLHFDVADGLLAQRMEIFEKILTLDLNKPTRTQKTLKT
ncbi:MAG: hypothetical protein HUJ61_06385, partial [Bacilli bacterium]|nr:hypothetical protein [Bacilli bacterium]